MIRTPRLVMRRWRDDDREPFAALNADEEVGGWLAGPFTRAQSDQQIDHLEAHADVHGFTFWALAEAASDRLVGLCGLKSMKDMPCRPGIEVGWRLARAEWGKGYVSEAAKACLAHAWNLGLPEVLAITAVSNARSRAVMERIDMRRELDGDFDHPQLGADHPLRRHVLYAIGRPPA